MSDTKQQGAFVLTLMHARTNAHLLHLQARSLAVHLALDELYKGLPDLVDQLVETYQGDHGLISYKLDEPTYELPPKSATQFVTDTLAFIDANRKGFADDSKLQNLIDEIAQLFSTTLYKLRFLG